MITLPSVVPPLPHEDVYGRSLPASAAFGWVRAGWKDLVTEPTPSLAYGGAVFLVSLAIVWGMFALGWDYILFPALAGFMVVGPVLAVGLYEKSRRLSHGEHVSLSTMIFVEARSGAQILFIGLILCLLML